MLIDLPESIDLVGRNAKDLIGAEKTKYDIYVAERARRKDPSQPDVAQEIVDGIIELKASKRPITEIDTVYGYSLALAANLAIKEQARIVKELNCKATAEIVVNEACPLVPEEVRVAEGIVEFVPKVVDKEPVVVEG